MRFLNWLGCFIFRHGICVLSALIAREEHSLSQLIGYIILFEIVFSLGEHGFAKVVLDVANPQPKV